MTWTGVHTVRIWRLRRELGRCKFCREPIVWVLTEENRRLPFNPHEKPIRQETHPTTQVVFDVFAKSASHLWTCAAKRPATRPPAPAPFCVCTHRRGDHVDGHGACYHEGGQRSRVCECRMFRPAPRVSTPPGSLF